MGLRPALCGGPCSTEHVEYAEIRLCLQVMFTHYRPIGALTPVLPELQGKIVQIMPS